MRIDHVVRKNERTTGRHAARTRRRRRPFVEGLEDRALLTTFFTPHIVEQAQDGGGDRLGTVAWGMPLYTIYWGSYWASADGQALQSQIQNSLNPMLYFSHYLDGLRQYGVPNHAGVPGSGTVEVNNFSDPANGFSKSNLDRRHQQRDRQPGAARFRRLLQRGALPGLHPPRHQFRPGRPQGAARWGLPLR